jgi:hypothetical protein
MIEIDPAQVAILWCAVGLAFIGTLNIRGFFRSLLAWFVTVAIATVAVFFSYAYSKSVLAPEPRFSFDENSSAKKDSVEKNYSAVEKQLLEYALAISDSILAFPKMKSINEQGIEKLETFQSKALSLRNKSMGIYRQVRSLTLPAEEKAYHDLLLSAAENLRLAGYEIHRQFGHEQDSISDDLNKAAVHAAQAKGAFLQLKEQL